MPLQTKKLLNKSYKSPCDLKKILASKKGLAVPRWPLFILYILGLLLALSSALPAYIQSNFLEGFVNLRTVSLFFVIANLLTISAILAFPKVIRELSNYFTTKIVVILHAVSLLSLSLTNSPVTALLSIILFTVSSNLIWINLDLLVEKFSVNSSTGRTRTIYFTFINSGWILAPIFSSYLINVGSYELTFLISAFLSLPVFLILLAYGRRLSGHANYQPENILLLIRKMWRNQNLRGIFFISLLLHFFYSFGVVYIPIYLHQTLGMGWDVIGIIFSIMLIPFVVFEIPAGIVADKYWGEKEILYFGFFILVISLLLFSYVTVPTAWIWAIVLFLSRTGAALVEAMRETYFFKLVGAKDVGYINLFRLSGPLAYTIGPLLAILALTFWPINYVFLIAALIMISGFWFVSSIKDTK